MRFIGTKGSPEGVHNEVRGTPLSGLTYLDEEDEEEAEDDMIHDDDDDDDDDDDEVLSCVGFVQVTFGYYPDKPTRLHLGYWVGGGERL
jgi:hypothetical protein